MRWPPARALLQDVPGAHVVRHPIDPGAQRAPPVEPGQAPPQRQVDLLHQIPPPVGIGLIRPGQPLERRPERAGGQRIPFLLPVPVTHPQPAGCVRLG